jgi:pimeloyl-ACP methyl ester carboxylesterase
MAAPATTHFLTLSKRWGNKMTNANCALSLALFLLISLNIKPANSQQHSYIETDVLFANATNDQGKLSPGGGYFSYITRDDGEGVLQLVHLESMNAVELIRIGKTMNLVEYLWVSEKLLQLNVYDGFKTVYYLVAFNTDENTGELSLDGGYNKLESGYIVDVLPDEPDLILFAKVEVDGGDVVQYLYRMTIAQFRSQRFRSAELIEEAPEELKVYVFDDLADKLIGLFYNEEEEIIDVKYKNLGQSAWTLIFSVSSEIRMKPIGFIDDNTFAVLTNEGAEKIVLRSYDIKQQALGEVLFEHEKYDLTNASLSKDGEIQAVQYVQSGLPQTEWLNSISKAFAARVDKSFDSGVTRIIGAHGPSDQLLVFLYGPNNPGQYYLYEGSQDRMSELVSRFPNLANIRFPKHEVFKVKDAEGVEIEAYLTTPDGENALDHKSLLVMPHGGPIGTRDYNLFSREVQYLSNRGFSILRVNFRGSVGFGKAFQEDGVGEFGQQIESDISLVVEHVLGKHQYDNVCAIGSSYGGYSSFMLAKKHPDIYKCIVAKFGVYDLPLLFNYSNIRSGKEFGEHIARTVGENKADNVDISPVYNAQDIDVPILLIAGKKDDTAGFEQSNRMRYVLEKLNKQVEHVFYKDAGHGHSSWYGDRHENAYVVDFLLNSLNLSRPKRIEMSEENVAVMAYDYLHLSDGFDNNKFLSRDGKKVLEYLTLASDFDATRAVFNLAAHYHRGDQVEKDMDKALELYTKAGELGYEGAYERLSNLYLGMSEVERNDEKALEVIELLIEKEDTIDIRSKESRFYCIADAPYFSFEKCLGGFKEQIAAAKSDVDNDYKSIALNLTQALVFGHFNQQQQQEFSALVIDYLNIDFPDFEFDKEDSGIWVYQNSDRYGRSGEYELADTQTLASVRDKMGNNDIVVGTIFKADYEGMANSQKATIVLAHWEEFDATGKRIGNRLEQRRGSAKRKWFMRNAINEYSPGHVYRVTFYDIFAQMKFQQEFQ